MNVGWMLIAIVVLACFGSWLHTRWVLRQARRDAEAMRRHLREVGL